MKRWSGRTLAAASALVWLAASPVRADQMPSFSYSWDQTPTTIAADGSGTGSISVSVGSGTATAPSTIVAANLSVISSAISPTLDTYTNKAYQLTLSRSEEHTSELQSLTNLVCRLLLEKKNATQQPDHTHQRKPP